MGCCLFLVYYAVVFLVLWKIFMKITNGFCWSNTCLVGKTVLITGGTAGIGYETALSIAARGANVIIAARSVNEEFRQKVIKETNNPNIVIKKLDVSSLKQVRQFAKELKSEVDKIDILINNAGAPSLTNTYTDEGLHKAMAVNHFGPFLLTILLLDLLKKPEKARIIFLSSIAAYFNKLSNISVLNNPYGDKKAPTTFLKDGEAYSNGKFCNVVTANVLAKKLKGTNITVNSCHPGAVDTLFLGKMLENFVPAPVTTIANKLTGIIFKNAREGAQTTLHLALERKLDDVTGKFFLDCIQFISPSRDFELAKEIWDESEKLVNLTAEEKSVLGNTLYFS